RELERQSARLEHAALHGLGDLAQVAVAGIELAPRLGDADERAREVLAREPGAAGVGAADEEAEGGIAVVGEPAADAARRVAAGGGVAHRRRIVSPRSGGGQAPAGGGRGGRRRRCILAAVNIARTKVRGFQRKEPGLEPESLALARGARPQLQLGRFYRGDRRSSLALKG